LAAVSAAPRAANPASPGSVKSRTMHSRRENIVNSET
jgi:hypothetical protein